MAEQSLEYAPSLIRKQVWTFSIQGGQIFELSMRQHPRLAHIPGSTTVWKMVGLEAEAESIKNCVQALGCQVQIFTEVQTEDQLSERLGLLNPLARL